MELEPVEVVVVEEVDLVVVELLVVVVFELVVEDFELVVDVVEVDELEPELVPVELNVDPMGPTLMFE